LAALGKLIRRLKDEQETSIDAEFDA
jgi:hypothetical protein